MNIGIIIARLNPLHIGHEKIINSSIINNDKTIIILGSAQIKSPNNPLNIKKRKEIIKIVFGNEINSGVLEIRQINDYKSEKLWIKKIKLNLGEYLGENLTFFGGDLKNDYAIRILNEFKNEFKNINFKEIKRDIIPISSTKIRELLKNKDLNNLSKWVDKKEFYYLIKNSNLF